MSVSLRPLKELVASFDRVVISDRVLTPQGVIAAQIGIRNGRIAALVAPGESVTAGEVVDAVGLAVIPGAVDVHTHLRDPGYDHKEDFASGTAAAAAGGWTTVIAQPNTNPPLTDVAAFREAVAIGTRKALVDFGVAAMATPGNVEELPALRAAGATLFEVAMADVPPDWRVDSLADFARVLDVGRSTGTLVAVYATDSSLVEAHTRSVIASGRTDALAPTAARPGYAEAAAVAAVLEVARGVGAAVHIRQVSTAAGAEAVARGKSGLDATAEVNPHHLFLTTREAAELGPWGRVLPPLRDAVDRDRLWAALADGTIDFISTDHAPHAAAEKEAGARDIWKSAPGLPALETTVPLLLDRVAAGEITIEQLSLWTAARPARRVGLYPRKGCIWPGADADLVLVDAGAAHVVDPNRFQGKARWSPLAGRRLRGKIVATWVRGELVYRDDHIVARGTGRFLAAHGA